MCPASYAGCAKTLRDASPDRARSRRIDEPQRGPTGDEHVKGGHDRTQNLLQCQRALRPLRAADCRLTPSLVMGADLVIPSFLLHHPVRSAARANSAIRRHSSTEVCSSADPGISAVAARCGYPAPAGPPSNATWLGSCGDRAPGLADTLLLGHHSWHLPHWRRTMEPGVRWPGAWRSFSHRPPGTAPEPGISLPPGAP